MNLTPNENQGFQNRFNHSAVSADDTEVFVLGANNVDQPIVFYRGTDAITEADFVNYPINTVIIDFQAKKIGFKDAAAGTTSFVWSAALT